MKVLYYPIQVIASTDNTEWPSLLTACLLYSIITAVFEILYRTRKNLTPE